MLVLSFIAYPLLMAVLALLVRTVRPDWRTMKIVVLTNLPLPVCAMVIAGLGVASIGPAPPGEMDASGMAVVVYLMLGMFAAFWMLVLGMPASWVALHWTRRRG
ncbi:hypothetical protein [Sphingomonas faeni]|uniref:hypothetical protein n=1 Tax=Sphingomonas faeni TaxID=185950 RepID=UPI0033575855